MASPTAAERAPVAPPRHVELDVEVPNPQGMHAWPATLVARVASKYGCDVTIRCGGQVVDAKEIIQLLGLDARRGTKLTIAAHGADAQEAAEAVADLVRRGFDEMPEAPADRGGGKP